MLQRALTVLGLVPCVSSVLRCSLAVACARFNSTKSAIPAVVAAAVCLGLASSVVVAAAVAVALGLAPSVVLADVCTYFLQKKNRSSNWSRT